MLLFFLFSPIFSTFRPDHSVSLSVLAPWDEVPLFDQLLYFICDFSIHSGRDFVIKVLDNFEKINDADFLWTTAKSIITTDSIPLMEAQVDTGFFLPRAEMNREIAREIGGSNYPDLILTGSIEAFDNDFIPDLVYPSNFSHHHMNDIIFGGNLACNYLYANLQNKTVADIILKLVKSEKVFVLRPTSKTSNFGIKLKGFGIEMRPFKYSMEYGVKDSIVMDAAKGINDSLTDETVELIKNQDTIPDSYIHPNSLINIGPKLVAFLKQNANISVTRLLRDVSNNFPLFFPQISKINPKPEDMNAFSKLPHFYEESESLINGRSFPLKDADIFSLLDIVSQEQNFINVLESHFKMDNRTIKSLSSLNPQPSESFIVDYRSNIITYFNDIEKDPEYKVFSTDLYDLFNSFTGFPFIRKNIINLIFIGNPISQNGIQSLLSIYLMIQQQIPIRFGIAPIFSMGNKLGRKVAYAFHHLALTTGQKSAILFLLGSLINELDDEHITLPSESQFSRQYFETFASFNNSLNAKTYIPWDDLYKLYDPYSNESIRIAETNEYAKRLGVKSNVNLLNGKPLSSESMIPQNLMYEIQQVIETFQSIIYSENYRSLPSAHVIDLFRKYITVVPTIDMQIFQEKPKSLELMHQSLSNQLQFAEFLSHVEWNHTDKGLASSFFMLFCPKEANMTIFERFMNDNHSVPTSFVINPDFPMNIYHVDRTQITLIANGRIFENFDLTDYNKLKMIDFWSKMNLHETLKPYFSSFKYKRAEAISFLSCILTDWISEGIDRKELPGHIWYYKTPLIYCTNRQGIRWDIIVNPFTREFQRISDLVYYVDKLHLINIRLVLATPKSLSIEEVGPNGNSIYLTTLSSYYRSSLSDKQALFTMLNDTTTYSVMPDMPNSWIFESLRASVDLDNILLKELTPGTHEGVYILTNIMIEGICYSNTGEYAEGAELALVDSQGEKKSDTIVMMSNGYWQLQATPGRFRIELGGKRSKMVYEMLPHYVTISSFATSMRKLIVNVNPGMEGLKVYNMSVTDLSNTTRVDVFSVASGHLYERLLKIMMLAVRKRSKYNVKFWIIKGFLSPQFKATLPIMSKKYNFSYQLVSYKWPSWLYPQYEKQRIIWGNKILFLDVLFPLDLERVIYIDSDQIVRADLIELMRMDFGDAPYAFTPFCDSRKETERFRFWKQGFWASHLGKKKYHISALFAIDLRRFRQMAVGDWLRFHYQQLSPNPDSLANLDQDLPNYAQSHIPIYSLPQEWLWCETWCSDETLKKAKTIDLCNNPLTKKPKLFVAQNMIEEWPGLDEEARNISAGPNDYQDLFLKQYEK